jgi:hypothetical protein
VSKLDHYERKKQFVISLPPTVARWLEVYGNYNLSMGILEAARQLTDVDALYPARLKTHSPRRSTMKPHEDRKAEADNVADWSENQPKYDWDHRPPPDPPARAAETEQERMERIARNTAVALKGVELGRDRHRAEARQQVIDEHFRQSCDAFEKGASLPLHEALMYSDRPVYDIVMGRCKHAFGWEKGPKPDLPADGSDVFGPTESAAPKPAAEPQHDAADAEQHQAGEAEVDVCRNCLVVLEVTDPLPATCPHCQIVDPLDARIGSARREPAASTAVVAEAADPDPAAPVHPSEPTF